MSSDFRRRAAFGCRRCRTAPALMHSRAELGRQASGHQVESGNYVLQEEKNFTNKEFTQCVSPFHIPRPLIAVGPYARATKCG